MWKSLWPSNFSSSTFIGAIFGSVLARKTKGTTTTQNPNQKLATQNMYRKRKESTKKIGSGISKMLVEILITLTRFQRKSQEHYKKSDYNSPNIPNNNT